MWPWSILTSGLRVLTVIWGSAKLVSEDLPDLQQLLLSKGSVVELDLAQVQRMLLSHPVIQICIALLLCARHCWKLSKGLYWQVTVSRWVSVLFCGILHTLSWIWSNPLYPLKLVGSVNPGWFSWKPRLWALFRRELSLAVGQEPSCSWALPPGALVRVCETSL